VNHSYHGVDPAKYGVQKKDSPEETPFEKEQ
jgi:hypothetical protein